MFFYSSISQGVVLRNWISKILTVPAWVRENHYPWFWGIKLIRHSSQWIWNIIELWPHHCPIWLFQTFYDGISQFSHGDFFKIENCIFDNHRFLHGVLIISAVWLPGTFICASDGPHFHDGICWCSLRTLNTSIRWVLMLWHDSYFHYMALLKHCLLWLLTEVISNNLL